jgi:hypothetical protein
MRRSSVANVGVPLQEAVSISSQLFLMAFNNQWTVSYEEAWVPNPSFNNLQHSRALLPNKTQNFIYVLMPVHKKLPHSLSQSIANQQLTSQRLCILVIAAMVPSTPLTCLESSHMKHSTVLPPFTKLLKCHIFFTLIKISENLFQTVYVHYLFTWVPFSILVNARFEVLIVVL